MDKENITSTFNSVMNVHVIGCPCDALGFSGNSSFCQAHAETPASTYRQYQNFIASKFSVNILQWLTVVKTVPIVNDGCHQKELYYPINIDERTRLLIFKIFSS